MGCSVQAAAEVSRGAQEACYLVLQFNRAAGGEPLLKVVARDMQCGVGNVRGDDVCVISPVFVEVEGDGPSYPCWIVGALGVGQGVEYRIRAGVDPMPCC